LQNSPDFQLREANRPSLAAMFPFHVQVFEKDPAYYCWPVVGT